MNVLPTSPDGAASSEQIEQYFTDMKRWNFDVAYTAFYAFPLKEVNGPFKKPYQDFAKYAHDKGYPACVQIQSTVGFLDDVDIENAQYYSDNTTNNTDCRCFEEELKQDVAPFGTNGFA